MTVLFECMDGPWQGNMISYTDGKLSVKRNSVAPILNFVQADDDIRFHQEILPSGNRMFKKPTGGYMRFDDSGNALPWRDIDQKDQNSWEGKFKVVFKEPPKTTN
eukprot:Seg298.19 transcript_id=Seg298.19/GoldUCD/mRNA.D3Y31 product="hypothetical protein" protein_id=Seg298.19/GoldUCD/D3Y31